MTFDPTHKRGKSMELNRVELYTIMVALRTDADIMARQSRSRTMGGERHATDRKALRNNAEYNRTLADRFERELQLTQFRVDIPD
jgi:hypothetical protein